MDPLTAANINLLRAQADVAQAEAEALEGDVARPLHRITAGDHAIEGNVRTGEKYTAVQGVALPLLEDLETLREARRRIAARLSRFFIAQGQSSVGCEIMATNDPLFDFIPKLSGHAHRPPGLMD